MRFCNTAIPWQHFRHSITFAACRRHQRCRLPQLRTLATSRTTLAQITDHEELVKPAATDHASTQARSAVQEIARSNPLEPRTPTEKDEHNYASSGSVSPQPSESSSDGHVRVANNTVKKDISNESRELISRGLKQEMSSVHNVAKLSGTQMCTLLTDGSRTTVSGPCGPCLFDTSDLTPSVH